MATTSVTSGQIVDNATIAAGNTEVVFAGGTTNHNVLTGTGQEIVSSGGHANTTSLTSAGSVLTVDAGGSATLPIISAGTLVVSAGAVMNGGINFTQNYSGTIHLDETLPNDVINNFLPGDAIVFSAGADPGLSLNTLLVNGVNVTVTEGLNIYQLNIANAPTDHLTLADTANGYLELVAATCYLAGTHIATPAGETSVEALAIGDVVLTASGQQRPVKWIGKRSYAPRFAATAAQLQPVLFRAGSLAENVPHRDLTVSPEHAMFLDGVLVPAYLLLNGSTVVRAPVTGAIEYFHVELDTHDVLLAEGAPSESFVDDDSRLLFQNAAEFAALYPQDARKQPGFCAPRVTHGYALEAIRIRLAARGDVAAVAA